MSHADFPDDGFVIHDGFLSDCVIALAETTICLSLQRHAMAKSVIGGGSGAAPSARLAVD